MSRAPFACAYCGKPAHRKTEEVVNPLLMGTAGSRAEMEAQGLTAETWRYTGNKNVLRTKMDDPSTWGSDKPKRIWSVTVWDGETWELGRDPFCTLTCAEAFARAAFKAGYRMRGAKEEAA